MNQLLEAALRYASIGWHVFPVLPGKKIPATQHGCKDATSNEWKIREWWSKWPDANVAVLCGPESGIYVVDIDVVSESVNGYDSMKSLPNLPPTVLQNTPRGGCHAFFKADTAPQNKNSFLPGVDIRSSGYYVLLSPSVLADGKGYCWAEGMDPWSVQLAEYPDFLRPALRNEVAHVELPRSTAGCDDRQRRASLYLAQCDPAVQGGAGHDSLFWACGAMTWGCEMTDSQAYGILSSEYNPRCMPPWDLGDAKDEKDFRRKIQQSIKNPPDKPRGWILNDPAYAAPKPATGPAVDLSGLLGSIKSHVLSSAEPFSTAMQQSDCQYVRPEFHKRKWSGANKEARKRELDFLCCPTGLVGEICSWINSTSRRTQPILTLGCVLTFMGALVGRKVEDQGGGRTNLYAMGIAPSSAGKAHPMDQIRRLCLDAGAVGLLGGDNAASDTGLEERMSKSPATLFLWDEVGHILCNIKSGASKHNAQLVSLLMKLYSSAGNAYLGREYSDQTKQRLIVEPCCCVYGTSTLIRFAEGLSPDELIDGWLSRCLVFYTGERPLKNRDREKEPVPNDLVQKVSEWYNRVTDMPNDGKTIANYVIGEIDELSSVEKTNPIIVRTTLDAEKRFIAYDDMSMRRAETEEGMGCIWAKAEENARRIALIMAASNSFDKPEITLPVADFSCRLGKYLVEDFEILIVPEIMSGENEIRKSKITKLIEKAGTAGMTKAKLTNNTRWCDKNTRDKIIYDLIEGESVVIDKGKDGTLLYWTAENYDLYKEEAGV